MTTEDPSIPSLEATLEKIHSLASKSQEGIPPEVKAALAGESPVAPTEVGVPDLPKAPVTPANPEPTSSSQASGESAPQEAPVSARLRKLLERESALIERENALRGAAPATQETPTLTLEQLKRMYRQDPVAALKVLDEQFKSGALAKKLWYHDLGDLAPKDARAEYEAERASGSVEVLRAELESTKQQLIAEMNNRQNEMAYQQYVGATSAYAQAVPDTLPLTKKFAAKKPEKVVQALVGVARKHAAAHGGQVLTPEQAATKLEASLRELQLNEAAAPVTTTSPAPPTNTQPTANTPNTLRNKHTIVQGNRVTDEPSDEELMKRTMQAIEAAKKRAESLYK